MEERKPIRIEARVRNNILWHAIFDKYKSVAELCRMLHLSQTDVGKLLNLIISPRREDGEFRKLCQKLAVIFKMLPEDLFPAELYRLQKTKVAAELPLKVLSSPKISALLSEPVTPFEAAVQSELKREIGEALNTLTERERIILEERFFHGKTQNEVGQKLSVGRSGVSEIEMRALRKLRQPSRGKKLRSFVE